MRTTEQGRRLPIGAEIVPGDGVHFRVWAPRHDAVDVVCESDERHPALSVSLTSEGQGYFWGNVTEAGAGTRYHFRLKGKRFSDPASRFQPDGPHGASQVIDPSAFVWTDAAWSGPPAEDRVIYEMHIGTFTPEGTWRGAEAELPALADLGMNVLEVLPIGDFPGRFGWGYDGVNLFAPTRLYGTPDDLRRFVDRAHSLNMAVILDVIYNHFGPDGNVLLEYSADYLSGRTSTEWGSAVNYDGENSGPVREFVLANAGYWVDEFHIDGLRIDATQSIFDDSPEHILAAVARRVRTRAQARRTFLVAESECQDPRLATPTDRGGYGLDAVWSEDFHHVAMIAATGRREAYYGDYRGSAQEFVSLARHGFLYQGQWDARQGKRRGSPSWGLEPPSFVNYLQNHDQVANNARGERFHQLTDPGLYRALTTLLLLVPQTPMLFQGQEFAASSPFHYFGDLERAIAEATYRGRQDFLSQFPSLATTTMRALVRRPDDLETFERSKLDHSERSSHAEAYALHRDLLRLRRDDRALRVRVRGQLEGAVLGPGAFVLRYLGEGGDDRLLLANLGPELSLTPAPEPLLAPPSGALWTMSWSSEDPRYGGGGIVALSAEETWNLTGHAAMLLRPVHEDEHSDEIHGAQASVRP